MSWFAIAALLFWPLVAVWLFRTRPLNQAILWTILGAQLLLPVGTSIKIAPGIPQLDKISIPNVMALVGCAFIARRALRFRYGFGVAEALLLMSLVGPFVTSELNGDVIFAGGSTVLPSVGHYEALSAVVAQLLFLLPFFVGRQFLRSSADNEEIMRILVIAGLLYSLPMLFEIRFSPQLHRWFYGYDPTDFIQEMRDGGFRPMVFMGHGLMAALFMAMMAVAAAALWRTQTRVARIAPFGVAAYLGAILVLCKSLGALVYGAVLIPLVRWATPRLQVNVALALVAIALLYPLLRAEDLVPTKTMVDYATSISQDRGASLEFRFDNEQRLLDHASQRILFGWGRFGRSRVYAENGKDISVTDGGWIITIGQFGLFGFIAEFGLLAFPVWRAASALRFPESTSDAVCLAALALILAINMIDLLPNSGLTPWTWLLAGALLGRAEALRTAALSRQRPIHAPALGGGNIRQLGLGKPAESSSAGALARTDLAKTTIRDRSDP